VTLDAVEEAGVFLFMGQSLCYQRPPGPTLATMTYRRELCQYSSVCQTENLVAEDGPYQPSDSHHAKCAQSHQHERVQATELGRECSVVAVGHHRGQAIVCDAHGAYHGASLSNPPARSSQRKEVVPCESGLRCWRDPARGLR
jgi:hypothetical protein